MIRFLARAAFDAAGLALALVGLFIVLELWR